jgi:hypothetical protein
MATVNTLNPIKLLKETVEDRVRQNNAFIYNPLKYAEIKRK